MYMELLELAKKTEGLQTASSFAKILGINKRTAINYLWRLRKEGYLTTHYGSGKRKIRLYHISPLKKARVGYSFYELLNKYSKVKIAVKQEYYIVTKKEPSPEEILVRAIAMGDFRVVLASLGLFNKVKNWAMIKEFADKYDNGRKIGALYDVARTAIKVRRMDERTRRGLRRGKKGFIVKPLKSKDFQAIAKSWGVFIPFNKKDLEVYKE